MTTTPGAYSAFIRAALPAGTGYVFPQTRLFHQQAMNLLHRVDLMRGDARRESVLFRIYGAKTELIIDRDKENRVLEYWTAKKKRLDQNQQFCLFERSARQSLAWIKEEGDNYLSTHTKVGTNKEETEQLLKEHNSFKVGKEKEDLVRNRPTAEEL